MKMTLSKKTYRHPPILTSRNAQSVGSKTDLADLEDHVFRQKDLTDLGLELEQLFFASGEEGLLAEKKALIFWVRRVLFPP